MKDTKRIPFDFLPSEIETMEWLEGVMGARTKAEVVRRSVSLFAFLAQKRRDGKLKELDLETLLHDIKGE